MIGVTTLEPKVLFDIFIVTKTEMCTGLLSTNKSTISFADDQSQTLEAKYYLIFSFFSTTCLCVSSRVNSCNKFCHWKIFFLQNTYLFISQAGAGRAISNWWPLLCFVLKWVGKVHLKEHQNKLCLLIDTQSWPYFYPETKKVVRN